MKKNTKYIFSLMIAFGLMVLAQSCGDSLGIEDNYSKKLISGKDIKDISYKEFVKITRDTLIFYSDTTIHVDTVHYPIYDTINNSKNYPTKGVVFDIYSLIDSKSFQAYSSQSKAENSDVSVTYINDKPIFNVSVEILYSSYKNDPLYKLFNELPRNLKINVKGVTLYANYYYNLNGALSSGAYGSIELVNYEGRSFIYDGNNSGITFYIIKYITDPNDDKKVLYIKAAIEYHSRTSEYMIYNEINIALY
jgi:hypothetical protein